MSENPLGQSFRDRVKARYKELGDELTDLLQECIAEGKYEKERDIKKCFKQKLKANNLEKKVKEKKKDGADTLAIAARYVVTL